MKLTESMLRKMIIDVIAECYGWPVEKTVAVGPKSKISGDDRDAEGKKPNKNKKELAGKNPSLPANIAKSFGGGTAKGPALKESFKRITSEELRAWKEGDYSEQVSENVSKDPCIVCDTMTESVKLSKEGACEGCSPSLVKNGYQDE